MPDLTQSGPDWKAELNSGTAGSNREGRITDSGRGAAGSGRRAVFPIPRTMGFFAILISVLAFTAGWLKDELALFLLGTVFFTIMLYCFLGVFFLGFLYSRKALSMTISPETVHVGNEGELYIKTGDSTPRISPAGKNYFSRGNTFPRLPAILIRCELCLETRDGRIIRLYADPVVEQYSSFPVRERGAYYGEHDSFVIFDAPGFFRLSLPFKKNRSVRLLALPHPSVRSREHISFSLRSGGTGQRNGEHYRKSDELTDHRPYIAGDDPRRINWKLYGHAPMGELFVREGEPRPPPHSRLLILVDTEADRLLYTSDEGRRAVDLLCENALTAALEFSIRGMDIFIGYTGGEINGIKQGSMPNEGWGSLNAAELASALAWPAAIPWPRPASCKELQGKILQDLPLAPRDRNVLIFALPRTSAEPSALDRFLNNRETGQETDIVFLYDAQSKRAAELENAARVYASLCNRRLGVHAKKAAVDSAWIK